MKAIVTVGGWVLKKTTDTIVERIVKGQMDRVGTFNATCQRCGHEKSLVQISEGKQTALTCPKCQYASSITIQSVETLAIAHVNQANIITQQANIIVQNQGTIVAGQECYFFSRHTNKCLDVYAWGTSNGTNIQQWEFHGGNNQRWELIAAGDYWLIRSKHSGKCIDVFEWNKQDGANIQQWDCHGGGNQLWELIPTHDGYFQISNKHSGKCLDVYAWNQDNGTNIQQWTWHGGANQQWQILIPGKK